MIEFSVVKISTPYPEFKLGAGKRAREILVYFEDEGGFIIGERYIVVLNEDEDDGPNTSFFTDRHDYVPGDMSSIAIAQAAFPDIDFGDI